MSASESFPRIKTITVMHDLKIVRVDLHHTDTSPTILSRLREALGNGLPDFRLVDPKSNAVRLNWERFHEDITYSVQVIKPREDYNNKVDNTRERIDQIMATWCLQDESQILPEEITPREMS
jgi:hypothetical protein